MTQPLNSPVDVLARLDALIERASLSISMEQVVDAAEVRAAVAMALDALAAAEQGLALCTSTSMSAVESRDHRRAIVALAMVREAMSHTGTPPLQKLIDTAKLDAALANVGAAK